jgi:hypothetical protein
MKNQLQIPETVFIYTGKDGKPIINAPFFKDTMWLNQNQIAELFDTTQGNVSKHVANVYNDGELPENTTHSKTESVVNRGFRGQVSEQIDVYSLDMVIAVGYRVNSVKATEFRIWATNILREYIQKGFALDDERLKMAYPFDKAYFRELRDRIKEIRISERMLYQQLKDIYALSADYNQDKTQTLLFFQKVQNKVLFAISGKTAAEIVYNRADATKKAMGMSGGWAHAPDEKRILKQDAPIAKNYLEEPELEELKYIVNMFLDFAEHRAESEQHIFMKEWEQELDKFLEFHKKSVLPNAGKISHEQMLKKACEEYSKYKTKLKVNEKQESIKEYRADIKELEKILKKADG